MFKQIKTFVVRELSWLERETTFERQPGSDDVYLVNQDVKTGIRDAAIAILEESRFEKSQWVNVEKLPLIQLPNK